MIDTGKIAVELSKTFTVKQEWGDEAALESDMITVFMADNETPLAFVEVSNATPCVIVHKCVNPSSPVGIGTPVTIEFDPATGYTGVLHKVLHAVNRLAKLNVN